MEFKIDKAQIVWGMGLAKRGVDSGAEKPITSLLLVSAEGDNVYIRGMNQAVDIEVKIEAEVIKEGSCCVDPLVLGTIGNLQDGEVHFSYKKRMVIKQGSSRHVEVVAESQVYPSRKAENNFVKVNAQSLFNAISLCSQCVGSDGVQAGVLFKENKVMATNGVQLMIYDDIVLPVTESALLVSSALGVVNSIFKQEDEIEVCFERFAGFKNSNVIVWVSSLHGEFPRSDSLLENLYVKPVVFKMRVNRQELIRLLAIAESYSRRNAYGTTGLWMLPHTANQVKFHLEVLDVGEMDEVLKCEDIESSEDFGEGVVLYADNLKKVLGVVDDEIISITIRTQHDPFVVTSENDAYTYLQVLMPNYYKE